MQCIHSSHISCMSPIWGHSAIEHQIDRFQVEQNNAIRTLLRCKHYAQKNLLKANIVIQHRTKMDRFVTCNV